MLPQLSPENRALVFGLAGGMPLYLGWWRQESRVGENLPRLAGGGPGSPLLTEGRLIMDTEVGSEQAGAALYAIASEPPATRRFRTRSALIRPVLLTGFSRHA